MVKWKYAEKMVQSINLLFLYNAAGDIDPEATYSSGPTSTAFEHSSLPSTRSYGINLKLNF